MRKIVMFLLAFCLVAPVVDAQNKALEKELKKEYKDRKKELKKGGWEIFGTSRSADVTLLKHFDKLNTLGDDASLSDLRTSCGQLRERSRNERHGR